LDFRIKSLEIKMGMAVKEENYELAGVIKKAIAELQELESKISILNLALHNAVIDGANDDRIAELRSRIGKAEDQCIDIELHAMNAR
jgi:hypothetical protein